jgi:hypothetical protein
MLEVILFALMSSRSETPPDVWNCTNQVEVWCAADGCAATAPDEATPMDIYATSDGALSICAYSGCWEGEATLTEAEGRLLWTSQNMQWLSGTGGLDSDATLLVVSNDGVGFVRAGGFATPLLCSRKPQAAAQ